jgi:hypothetical protein
LKNPSDNNPNTESNCEQKQKEHVTQGLEVKTLPIQKGNIKAERHESADYREKPRPPDHSVHSSKLSVQQSYPASG